MIAACDSDTCELEKRGLGVVGNAAQVSWFWPQART